MKRRTVMGALALGMAATAVPQAAPAQDWRPHGERHDDKMRNTIIGAGLGLLGGAILSGGDPWATFAGAAAGGAIGNVTTNDRRHPRFRRWDAPGLGRDRWGDDRRDGWNGDRRPDDGWRH